MTRAAVLAVVASVAFAAPARAADQIGTPPADPTRSLGSRDVRIAPVEHAGPDVAAAWNATTGRAAGRLAQPVRLPANLVAAEPLRQLLRQMLDRSPTFRAQCTRIGRADSLSVVLRFGSATQAGQGGARTRYRRINDLSYAEVYLSADVTLNSQAMLIAHELEHIVEQLDGVELTGRAQHGVFRDSSGSFETARAAYMGEQVAEEVRRSQHSNRAGKPE